MPADPSPSHQDAIEIARALTGVDVAECVRFPTGLRHWVFDVVLADGQNIVVRMAGDANRAELAGGVFWNSQLKSVDVPVPDLIAFDVHAPRPYMVLERLAGTDLANTWDLLDDTELDLIASTVAGCQLHTSRLPSAGGFGYALDYSTRLADNWTEVIEASIARSRRRIVSAGVVDPHLADRVSTCLDHNRGMLQSIEPIAFLDDATTKNVIVNQGELVGIVDTDQVCFGDPLWAIALTRMSLLSARRPTRYTDRLADAMDLDDSARLGLYTSVFALDFLSELGQSFNRDQAPPASEQFRTHLTSVLDTSLDEAP